MTQTVRWRRLAEEDLASAYSYLAASDPSPAERFLDAVEEAIRMLLEHPAAGRRRAFRSLLAKDVRSWHVPGFPRYLIFYLGTDGGLEIVRIIHSARDFPRLFEDEVDPASIP